MMKRSPFADFTRLWATVGANVSPRLLKFDGHAAV